MQSPLQTEWNQIAFREKNRLCTNFFSHGIVTAIFFIACHPSVTAAQTTSTGASNPLADCNKRFRLAEISAQVPHEAGTMAEACLTIATSCLVGQELTKDCRSAMDNIPTIIANAVGSRNPKPTKLK
jgi:hypothetical protein